MTDSVNHPVKSDLGTVVQIAGTLVVFHDILAGDIFKVVDEDLTQDLRIDLTAGTVNIILNHSADFRVHGLGRIDAELFFQHINNAAFAGLAVDADEFFILAADVGRVDVQIRDLPALIEEVAAVTAFIQPLADRILMRTGESGKDQIARIGMTGMNFQAGVAFHDTDDFRHIAEAQPGFDAAGLHIQSQHRNIQIAGAFAMTEDRAFDTGRSGEQCQLGRGDGTALIVMGMQTDAGFRQIGIFPAEEFDHVGILVRGTAFHRGGQIQNKGIRRGGPPFFLDGTADINDEIQIAVGEFFGGELITDPSFEAFAFDRFFDHAGPFDRHLFDLIVFVTEDETAVQIAGSDVAMDDRMFHAAQGFDRLVDEVFAGLRQNADTDIIGNVVLFDQRADKVEVVSRCGRKRHFDLLETDADKHVEIFQLLCRVHGFGQSLIAVAEVHRGPHGRFGDDPVGPLAVLDLERFGITVFGIIAHFILTFIL